MKVLLNYQKITIVTLLALFSIACLGQDLENDKQILIDFYESTNGDNWSKNTNWLNEDAALDDWHGVVVEDGRVTELHLADNNLTNEIPSSFKNLNKLKKFNCAENSLRLLPILTELTHITFFDCRNNQLSFNSFYDNQNIEGIKFYPQKRFGLAYNELICIGDSLVIPIGLSVDGSNEYDWYKDGVLIDTPELLGSSLYIENGTSADRGKYTCQVRDNAIPNFSLSRNFVNLEICDYDSLGGPYKTNQVIVKFDPIVSDAVQDSIRSRYSVSSIDENLCESLELWFLPDTIVLPDGSILIIIEEITDNIREDPGVQEVDLNHISEPEETNTTLITSAIEQIPMLNTNASSTVEPCVVAIIDTGIDYNHPSLVNDLWINSQESLNGVDDDGNCVIDDILGVNFVAKNKPPFDDHSHGTHIAGIIKANASAPIELMALKTHNSKGIGDVFSMAGAIYYAQEQNVDIINMSTGYYGKENLILKQAIEAVQADDIIVVASAGNSGKYVDTIPHFPSGHDLDNIIAVGAVKDSSSQDLDWYSNYGPLTVDLATEGTDIISAMPGGGTGMKTGTSMAAAKVSGLLAQGISAEPEYCYREMISCLYNGVEEIPLLSTKLKTSGKAKVNFALNNCCNRPDSLKTRIISGNVVRISWQAANCMTYFQLMYRPINTMNVKSEFIDGSNTYLNDLLPNTSYEYAIRSLCGSGYSNWSNISYFHTSMQNCDIPKANEIFVGIPSDALASTLDISWIPQGVNLTYMFQYKKNNGAWIKLYTDEPKVTIPFSMGSAYKARIRTQCINGWTNWSRTISFPHMDLSRIVEEITPISRKDYFKFYPNPAEDEVRLEIHRSKKPQQLVLKNVSGKILESKDVRHYEFDLDLRSYNAGIYFVSILFENGQSVTKKVVKISP